MAFDLGALSKELDNLEAGDRIRVNHTDCVAGEDTRRRLYIERVLTDPTKVIYYCHNCADGGVVYSSNWEDYRATTHNKGTIAHVPKEVIEAPKGLVQVTADMPSYAQKFVVQNGLVDEWMERYGLGYDPQSDRFYLPQYSTIIRLQGCQELDPIDGYQLRLLRGTGPKYITCSMPTYEGWTRLTVYKASPLVKRAVIVEDLISGIHILEACHREGYDMTVAVNYGVKINTHLLYHLQSYDRVLVWLDNDSTYVRRQAEHIARTQQLYGVDAKPLIQPNLTDPKHFPATKLLQELRHGFA